MLRITGGKFRGRNLKTLKGKGTRPMLSRVRKSLFDIIGNRVEGADFLDLFAGTGSVGIEALSRNAHRAVFVENNQRAIQVIFQNLSMLGLQNSSEVYKINVLAWLDSVSEKNDASLKFDIIFVGPPYFKELANRTLQGISEAGVLKESGVIFVQHHKKEKITVPDPFTLIEQRRYGDIVLSIIKEKNK